jgi:DNA-directed RNA polymerase specialized sigma24 family protein
MRTMTDAELLDVYSSGKNEEAFGELMRRHGAMVYWACHRLLKDAHEAMAVIYRNIARMQTRRLKAFNIEVAEHRAQHMEIDPQTPAHAPSANAQEGDARPADGDRPEDSPTDEWQK